MIRRNISVFSLWPTTGQWLWRWCFLTLINSSFFRQFHWRQDSPFFFWHQSWLRFPLRSVTNCAGNWTLLTELSDKVPFEHYKSNRSLRWGRMRCSNRILNRRLLVVYGIPQYHFHDGLRSTAAKVLKLDMEGNQVRRGESCYRRVGCCDHPEERSFSDVKWKRVESIGLNVQDVKKNTDRPNLSVKLELVPHCRTTTLVWRNWRSVRSFRD